MTQNKITQIHRWYSWILAIMLAIWGVLLILSCLDIYTSGPRPYSGQAIAQRFQYIAVPVFITAAGIVAGIALDLLFPQPVKREKGISPPKSIMLRLRQKSNLPPVQKELRLRCALRVSTALCFVALMIYPLFYLLTPDHFSVSELNADVIKAVMITLIPSAVGLILCWICHTLVNSSYRREASIYKQELGRRQPAQGSAVATQPQACNCKLIHRIRIMIIVLAVVLLALGVVNGGAEDVLKKAIAICTECIGLG